MVHKGCINGCTKSDRKAPARKCSSYSATASSQATCMMRLNTRRGWRKKNKGLSGFPIPTIYLDKG